MHSTGWDRAKGQTSMAKKSGEPRKVEIDNKLSHTYATLLEALNRHRGKGQQKVMVENVHVHTGGQAGVGLLDARLLLASARQRNCARSSRTARFLSIARPGISPFGIGPAIR